MDSIWKLIKDRAVNAGETALLDGPEPGIMDIVALTEIALIMGEVTYQYDVESKVSNPLYEVFSNPVAGTYSSHWNYYSYSDAKSTSLTTDFSLNIISRNALTGGGITDFEDVVSLAKNSTIGAISIVIVDSINIMFAKGGKQNIRNEFSNYSPEELKEMYNNPSTSKSDRQKIKAAQKGKKVRHCSKNKEKKKSKKNEGDKNDR